ncbi:MAG TPA: hypothetical protein VFE34_06900 [Dongiaceae bacterium]|jgi:hypothetical protein|nr:hypothetical protein [Dongiaceae bacterium]
MVTIHAAQAGQGGAVRIACINKAKLELGVPFDKLTAALQKCYDQHFLPVWGYPVELYNTDKAKPTDWQFIYFDTPEDAGFLGYHELTKNGQPVAKIFLQPTFDAGDPISLTASHELFEMVIDPIANLWAEADDGTEYAYEMCDPVEEDRFLVDGLQMSNFVHPAWFEPFKHPKGTKFDHLGLLKKPFSMTKGGYVVRKIKGKAVEEFANDKKKKRFSKENRKGHRSEHRKLDGELIKPEKKKNKGKKHKKE